MDILPTSSIYRNTNQRPERRTSNRVPINLWVEESSEREIYFQRGTNLSTGGMYLANSIPHPKGTVIQLNFVLPPEQTPINVTAEVVNVGESADALGMGIKFLDLSEQDRQRIQQYIGMSS